MNRLILTLVCILSLGLAACAKKYEAPFKADLAEGLSTQLPLKLDQVSIKEVNKGAHGSEFTYAGTVITTSDLYSDVPILDDHDLALIPEVQSRLATVQLSPAEQTRFQAVLVAKALAINNVAEAKLRKASIDPEILKAIGTPGGAPSVFIKKLATPIGTRITMSGEAKAQVDDFGKWSFTSVNQTFGPYEGKRIGDEKWFLDGGQQAKVLREVFHDIVTQTAAAMDDAVKVINDEKQRIADENAAKAAKEADERKKALAAQVAACAPSMKYLGFWQFDQTKGEIGIRFDRQTDTGNGYSLEGVLFDPKNPDHTKPFTGALSGDGTAGNKFLFKLTTTKGEEGINAVPPNCGFFDPNTEPWAKPYFNKTSGFLLIGSSFPLELTFSPSSNMFTGKVIHQDKFSPFVEYSSQPITIFFKGDYQVKSEPTATDTSAGAAAEGTTPPQDAATGGKRTIEQVHQENAAVLKEFGEEFKAERFYKDLPRMKETMKKIVTKYPNTAVTHYWQMNIAVLEKNANELIKQYNILITDFPETPENSTNRDQMYQEFLKACTSGQ